MSDQDRDWLDERMAVGNYLPDDGFTARVVSRLPEVRPVSAVSPRRYILLGSTLLNFGLFAMLIGPLFQSLVYFMNHGIRIDGLQQFMATAQQPVVLYSVAGIIVVAAFASIPLLRRWA